MFRIVVIFLGVVYIASIGCDRKNGSIATSRTPSINTLSLGDSEAAFESFAGQFGGEDITPGLEIVGPNNEHPLHGIVWEFADYECVLSVAFSDDGKLTHLSFCSISDFYVSKFPRMESTSDITALTFNTDRTYKYTKVKP